MHISTLGVQLIICFLALVDQHPSLFFHTGVRMKECLPAVSMSRNTCLGLMPLPPPPQQKVQVSAATGLGCCFDLVPGPCLFGGCS